MAHKILLENAEVAADWARSIAVHLLAGDCLLLSGPVGAGKTHFARAAIQSLLLEPEDVPSPTFTLVQTYESRVGEIWHTDLYRLSHIEELEELGLEDALEQALTFVEWPERLGELRPNRYLTIDFSFVDDSDLRAATITPVGTGWGWLEQIT